MIALAIKVYSSLSILIETVEYPATLNAECVTEKLWLSSMLCTEKTFQVFRPS